MVETIKDLERLLKLARKQGVTEITLPTVSFKLGDLPIKHPNESIEDQEMDYSEQLEAPLTPQELVEFSNGVN